MLKSNQTIRLGSERVITEPYIYRERERKLIELARQELSETLTLGELRLIHNSVRPGPPTMLSVDEVKQRGATPYTVRGDMLRWLVNASGAAALVDPNGIWVVNTRINDEIDLSDCKVPFDLTFDTTHLSAGLVGSSGSFKRILIIRSHVAGQVRLDSSTVTANCEFPESEYIEEVNLNGAQITGNISLISSICHKNISLVGTHVDGEIYLQKATIHGEVSAIGVKTGGSISFDGASCLHTPVSVALDVGVIGAELFMQDFTARGIVKGPHLHVGQDIHAANAHFSGSHRQDDHPGDDPSSLLLMAATVEGQADFSRTTFAALAALAYAEVKERISFQEAQFTGKGRFLDLDSAVLGDDLTLRGIVAKDGSVSMFSGSVKGDVDFIEAALAYALFSEVNVGKSFYWVQLPHATKLDLSGSTIGTIVDDQPSWPPKGNLFLDGTKYNSLEILPPVSKSDRLRLRIEWLKRRDTDATSPQPWQQLATFLEASGDKEGAKHVMFVYSRMQAQRAGWWRRPGSWVYDKIEEEPLRIIAPVSGFWILGAVIFWRAQRMAKMAPSDRATLERFNAGENIPNYPRFHPLAYALENVLPVIKLGQDAAWAPNPALAAPAARPGWRRFLPQVEYRWLVRLRWTLIIAGWVMALILAGAIGSRFK